jgi:phage baseplate assembly protein W
MRPSFGTLIPFSLFNGEESATSEIQEEVRIAFASRLSLLTLNETEVTQGSYAGEVIVTITYSLPNEEVQQTSVGFINIRGEFPPYEEKL